MNNHTTHLLAPAEDDPEDRRRRTGWIDEILESSEPYAPQVQATLTQRPGQGPFDQLRLSHRHPQAALITPIDLLCSREDEAQRRGDDSLFRLRN